MRKRLRGETHPRLAFVSRYSTHHRRLLIARGMIFNVLFVEKKTAKSFAYGAFIVVMGMHAMPNTRTSAGKGKSRSAQFSLISDNNFGQTYRLPQIDTICCMREYSIPPSHLEQLRILALQCFTYKTVPQENETEKSEIT